jgi:hypothetical protein
MTMLRLAERVMGEGRLTRDGATVGRAAYELSRYHEVAVEESGLRARGDIVEGHLHLSPEELEPLVGTAAPLTLHLDDGRRANVYVVNTDGVIASADARGFYRAE